ncbi:glutamine--fructose-6-phosphate transaminase (isomerizing) [Sinomonas atrocyanea]|jgi:glucosamine--fructose-6-phosphate aminotransferase (isomerizing)|uniref:glutamine--fructose-6-phosphate transaminase (isomerizing) n=1 Tax=Sinomonas atrocyanea TaxID=37927 RepID=UPI00278425DC|nr:glutamine--fructose-6-phosphate transaminase (isomerizing) [Sinomonas atrocyanea]MDQ0258706.1 glucosamine--fructose-6-phosphate aminotransferase (isomerizing) [Sinomonas atrocyanea]MDR6620893.1 glucosamine--fructose-6-phosphate aminotransferase (isomerizing) [Sinomonas atrocyanea]
MCGIVGYVGTARALAAADGNSSHSALDVVIEGLRRLEYRGYDSAGVAVVADGAIESRKKAGKLKNLEKELAERPLPESVTGIGHTRWATHGGPTDANAHPHLADGGRLAVIHNGIIENYASLKAELTAKGVPFLSETDTEVAAALIGDYYRGEADGDITRAMQLACQRLEGAFTLLAVHAEQPGVVVAARRNSPLVVGLGDGENFLGSDVSGFIDYTRRAVELGQDQIVTITPDSFEVTDFFGAPASGKEFEVSWDAASAEKGGFNSFMEKEINDQPAAVHDTLLGRSDASGRLVLDELRIDPEELKQVNKIIVLACGTAAYAGLVAKYAIEKWCRIPTEVELAHEFRYREPIVDAHTLVVSISQSGETMDTLMAVRYAREQGAKTVSICNTNGSTIPRESDAVLYTHAGPEIAVASTKAFLAQITAAYLLGLYLAQLRGNIFSGQIRDVLADLNKIPEKIQTVLDAAGPLRELARSMKDEKSVLFLGRHVGYPVALEGALKLKEIAYIHAEGFAAGELKHGPIALIDEGQPVFVVVPSPQGRDSLHAKVVSNIQEVRARGARTLVIAEEGDEAVRAYAEYVFYVPQTPPLLMPLLTTVPLQIFAAELASAKGYDVDQPRNLAKSVTVE